MKLFYTETIIENILFKIKEVADDKLNNYQINSPVAAIIKNINGEESLKNCFIDIDNQGILIVLMDTFKIDEIKGYKYCEFKDIQGIKIKKGIFNIIIKIQFIDGTKYIFQIVNRKLKYIPEQKDNLENIVSRLKSLNLINMENKIYKKNRRDNILFDLLYVTTLLILEFTIIIILNVYFKSIFQNELLFIVIVLLIFIFHAVMLFVFGLLIDYLRNVKFINEYTPIIKEHSQTKDANKLLHLLVNIKNFPKTQERKNIYYLSLSTAYYKMSNKVEAKNQLLKIKTSDKEIIKKIKRQLEIIEE